MKPKKINTAELVKAVQHQEKAQDDLAIRFEEETEQAAVVQFRICVSIFSVLFPVLWAIDFLAAPSTQALHPWTARALLELFFFVVFFLTFVPSFKPSTYFFMLATAMLIGLENLWVMAVERQAVLDQYVVFVLVFAVIGFLMPWGGLTIASICAPLYLCYPLGILIGRMPVTGYALVKSNIYLLLFLLLVAVVAAVNHSLRYKEFILKKRIQGENMALQGYQTRLKRAYERMESLAVIDPLTRVFNRAYLMQWLTSGVYQDKEASAFFSMIMYDLDRFKEINDIGGHQAGDQALQKLTEIVREEIEGGNMTFRYGGDEFCIVLPGWDLVRAVKTAEKIRQRIEKHPDMQVKFRTGETVQLTVSMGVTTEYILATIDPDFLIRWLDAALFESKRKGRNRVHVFDPVDRKIYDASEWSQRSEPKERT